MFTVLASMYCCCQWNITWLAVTLCPPQTGTVIYTRHLTFHFSGLLLRLTCIHLHLFLPTMSQQVLACEGALWSHPHCYFFHSYCCLLTVITTNPCQLQEHESASTFCVVLLLALTEELARSETSVNGILTEQLYGQDMTENRFLQNKSDLLLSAFINRKFKTSQF